MMHANARDYDFEQFTPPPDDESPWPNGPDDYRDEAHRRPDAAATVITPSPFVWRDPTTIPRRQWLYGRHYIRQFVSGTVAAGGVGKSSLVIVEALAMVTGKPLLGTAPDEVCRVWYWCGEDPLEEIERRVVAACIHYGITERDIGGRLYLDSGRQKEIIMASVGRSGLVVAKPIVEAVTKSIKDREIDAMIIDPFVSCHRIPENDNMAIDTVVTAWKSIADKTSAAIELVHHIKKTGGAEATFEDGRGGSSFGNAVRSGRVLNKMTKDEGDKAGVDNAYRFFRVSVGKANLALPSDKADWRELVSVRLGNGDGGLLDNGDEVGVVRKWEWPDPFANVSTADLLAAQRAVAAGGPWRENVQAADWVGIPVARALGLDLGEKAQKGKVRALIKTWTAAGMFVTVSGKDRKGNERPYLEVGTWANE